MFAAETLARPFLPWQRWAAIHAGELLPDCRPRFRVVHIIVARQNGKTEIPVVLSLFWQVIDQFEMVLGTSTKIDYSRESWMKAVHLATAAPGLKELVPAKRREWTRNTNGEQESWFPRDAPAPGENPLARYKIAAANADGGRSLSIDRLVLDELRQHDSYSAWDAAVPAASKPHSQVWTLSNAGTVKSVVLNDERKAALRFIETGEGDERTGLFEWSCPPDASPLDLEALAQANPALGITKHPDDLLGEARKSLDIGGDKLTGFRTESMCIYVPMLDPAIDATAWAAAEPAESLAAWRARVALCIDLAPDGLHATVYAAAVSPAGAVHVDPVQAWSGPTAPAELRRALAPLVRRIRPGALGWFPSGPAAAVAAQLAEQKGPDRWPPAGVKVEAIRGDTAAVCMGFAELVIARQLRHPNDPLLNAQVAGAERIKRGDTWVFGRTGASYVDALYAAAGAAHLARTMPPGPGRVRVVMPD